jgi:hypothetical protein
VNPGEPRRIAIRINLRSSTHDAGGDVMKKLYAAMTVAATLALTTTSSALAFHHEVGTTGVGTLSPISLASLTSCDRMSFTGHIKSNFRLYGDLGGSFQLDKAVFENCTAGTRVTLNLPVGFSVDPAGGYSVGLDVNITNARGTCRYSGSLLGSGGVSAANVGGDVYLLSSGCGGPSQFPVRTMLRYTDAQGGEL